MSGVIRHSIGVPDWQDVVAVRSFMLQMGTLIESQLRQFPDYRLCDIEFHSGYDFVELIFEPIPGSPAEQEAIRELAQGVQDWWARPAGGSD